MNSLERAVRKVFDVRSESGDELLCLCRWHEDTSPSLYINVIKGAYICFACGASGGPKALKKVLKMPADRLTPVDASRLRQQTDALMHRRAPERMPESVLRAYQATPTDLWASRGFSEKAIRMAGLGFDLDSNAGVIPFRTHNGNLLGVIRRYVDPTVKPKYRYPAGAPISQTLWGAWMMIDTDTVAICEGSLDAVSLWDADIPAVALLGCRMSDTQERLIGAMGINKVVLFLDNDKAGKEATKDIANRLRRRYLVSTATYPDRYAKDPGELSIDERKESVSRACVVRI
ncbi:MG010, DNA primase-like protein [uncultured Caudovirales phage]|uniref:MG010, DNA primase-like protein n=1 Tax=uncultured Caudovirales phage TaxID=2100421 RepID=A0A6J7WRL1_9CAUD|nr:MG010, DNA primase-like protein [uncultured Caudovirales phage]